MAQAVTKLVIDAGGAMRTLDQFERGMAQAGAAADLTTVASAKFAAGLRQISAEQAKGNQIASVSIGRASDTARSFERLQASISDAGAMQVKFYRQLERDAVTAINAVREGHVSEAAAMDLLIRKEEALTQRLMKQIQVEQAALAMNDNLAISTQQLADRKEHLRQTLDSTYASATKMDAALADLAEAERLGVRITGGYANALDALTLKFDDSARAAKAAAEQRAALVAQARAEQNVLDSQRHYSTLGGVRDVTPGSARDSAAVFEAAAREADEMARAAAALRAQIDPLGTAQRRMNMELAEYSTLASRGAISAAELGRAQTLARERFDQSTAIVKQFTAANDNASFATANLAAQFQDVAVTAAMGMSPLMIALQQGTQISAQLGPMGASGAVKGLGAAFLSVISPVSLVTIALVAGSAAAIQFIAGLGDSANAAEKAMRDAALSFDGVKSAMGELSSLQKDYQEALRATSTIHGQTSASIIADTQAEFTAKKSVLELQLRYQKALIEGQRAELQKKQEALRAEIESQVFTRMDLERRGYADPRVGRLVQVPDDVSGLEKTRKLLESSPIALELKKLRAEMGLSELAASQLEKALSTTFQTIESGADGLDKQRGSAANAYRDLRKDAEDRIAQMRQEIDLVGKVGAAVETQRFEMDLLQQATEKGRALDSGKINELKALSAEYGAVASKLAELRALEELNFERSQIGRTETEQRVYAEMRSIGLDINSAEGERVANQIRFNERLRETQRELEGVRDLGKEAFGGLVDLLYESGDLADKLIGLFAGIGRQFAQMGMERLWKSMSTGQSLFDALPSMASGAGSAAAPMRISATASASAGREIGLSIAPAISDSLNGSLVEFAAAIRKVESGSYAGDYNAVGPVSASGHRAYGAYQVKDSNVPPWTKDVLGYSLSLDEFLSDQTAQDKVFNAKFGQSLDKFGNFSDAASIWFSGRPVSRAGNSSDGYNTVPQYVSKANAALDAYPGGLRQGVADGVVDANRRISSSGSAPAEAAPASAQNGGNLQNMLGVGGAAIGAFAGGYQSGDPLMGGISGAMTGLGAAPALSALGLGAAAGPIGLIGGAIIGIIGGILGKAKQKREELKRAQEELESQMGAITELIATATGNFMGAFEKQFSSMSDEFQKAITMAEKAQNHELAGELDAAMDVFFDNLTDRWNRGFEGMIASLESGSGFDGAFIAGMDAVEKMKESLVGFVNDAKMFEQANGDLRAYYEDRRDAMGSRTGEMIYQSTDQHRSLSDNSEFTTNEFVKGYRDLGDQLVKLGVQAFSNLGGQLYGTLDELTNVAKRAGYEIDETGKLMKIAANDNVVLAGSVERARQAAIKTALATLTGAEEFTGMETAVQKLMGTVAGLPSLLDDLGMAADDAAAAIDGALLTAMGNLRFSVVEDLQRSINDLSGAGYINELLDAQTTYETRMRDLAAAGLDGSLALTELAARVRQIAGGADLSAEQLRQLANVMPEVGIGLINAISSAGTDPAAALSTAEADRDEARAALRSAYDAESRTIESVISKHEALTKSLKAFITDIRLDSNLSPLNRQAKLLEAQKQFADVSKLALGGDADAMGRLEDVGRDYLQQAKDYYASSESYFAIFGDVERVLTQALGLSDSQLTEAERQLAALKDLVSPLVDIDDSVKSVTEAIAGLNAVNTTYAAAQAASDAAMIQRLDSIAELLGRAKSGSGTTDIWSLFRDVLGRSPDAAGGAYWQQQISSGTATEKIYRDFIEAAIANGETVNAAMARRYGVPGFASGGMHRGGVRMVGEYGPEMESTGQAKIWNAEQTRRIMTPPDNSELVAEIRELGRAQAATQKQLKQVMATIAASGMQTAEAIERGNDILANVNSEMRRKSKG